MRIFLAGAAGVIGRRLVPLLRDAGHSVAGTTRSAAKAEALRGNGAEPVVVDVFDPDGLGAAMLAARPEVVIHQLTDLPAENDPAAIKASLGRNARIRTEGTRNLIAAAKALGATRLVVQSIAFVYPPGGEPHAETDPLNLMEGPSLQTVRGVADMEGQALSSGLDAVILRNGLLYGPDTWTATANMRPALHVDAAAQAAFAAVSRGSGIYNIADDDGAVTIDKARRELGFDPAFRLGGSAA